MTPSGSMSAGAVAVIADVHGNCDALQAVLADIDGRRIASILNLGDHLSGPLAAARTADILMTREMICIRGNHDRNLLEQMPDDMGASDRVAFDELAPAHLEWLRKMPQTRVVDDIFMCHGTPEDDLTYWLEEVGPGGAVSMRDRDAIEGFAAGIAQSLILCAHTHTARMVRLRDGRLIVNPGSVGLPAYDDDLPVPHVVASGAPEARYAIVERKLTGWDVTFRAIPYDTAAMAACARSHGRTEWACAVETGWLR